MILLKYVLYRYYGSGEEWNCFEHEDETKVVEEALRLSSQDNGAYTYRIQPEVNREVRMGGWRYFESGREFTRDFINAVLNVT